MNISNINMHYSYPSDILPSLKGNLKLTSHQEQVTCRKHIQDPLASPHPSSHLFSVLYFLVIPVVAPLSAHTLSHSTVTFQIDDMWFQPFYHFHFFKSSILCYLLSLWHITRMPAVPSCTFAYFFCVCPPWVTQHLFKPSPPLPQKNPLTETHGWQWALHWWFHPRQKRQPRNTLLPQSPLGLCSFSLPPLYLCLFSAHLNNEGPVWPSSSPSLLVAWVEQRFPSQCAHS